MFPSPPPVEGQIINGYRIAGRLGLGGMGVVYRAFDIKLERQVALKFLPPSMAEDEHARTAFLYEARAASALDHPNIGAIYGIEETATGQPFIVMAFYEGQTLSARLSSGPIALEEALSIAIQVARGIEEAHARNIVHRDIKPSNILLTAQGIAKIVDFGIARLVSSESITQTGGISGTAAYMSPEQAAGRAVDRRTDLWSLGVVLHEMVTGRNAFEAENMPATLFAIVYSAPLPPAEGLQPAVEQIIYRVLAKNPDNRYQTAADMIRDLEAASRGTSGNTDPVLVAQRLDQVRGFASQTTSSGEAFVAPSPTRAWILPVAACAIFVVAGTPLLIPQVRHFLAETFFSGASKHIAVLPLATEGSEPGDAALADGLMESLTNRLSNLQAGNQSLWVVPASEVRRRKVADPASALKTFGANLAVLGAVRRDAAGVHLTINLIDTRNTRQLGSAEFADRSGDFSAVQDAAIVKLTEWMNIAPGREPSARKTSTTPAAYQSYLQALGYIQRYDKPANLDRAAGLLNDAVKADPKFALAFAALGEAYLLKYRATHERQWLDQATASCTRALQLSDSLAPVYVTMGRIHENSGNPALALQEFQRAMELEPHNADALFGIAAVNEEQGRAKEAEEMFRRAAALRPDYWDGYNKLGSFYLRQKRWSEADREYQRVIGLVPDNVAGYVNRGAALMNMGRLDEAAAALKKAAGLSPSYAVYANLGNLYFRKGDFANAVQFTRKALELNGQDYRVWVNLAGSYRWLNQDEDARQAYQRALPLAEEQVKLQPQDALLQAQMAELYAHSGDKTKALLRMDAALALAPGDRDVLVRCADVCDRLGDRARAVEFANKAVALGFPIDQLKLDPEARGIIADPNFHNARR